MKSPSPAPTRIISPTEFENAVQAVVTPACGEETENSSRCPIAKEFRQIRERHSTLASTGCTKDFCQAGRAVHSDEPRIGENRGADMVGREAESFLREFHHEQSAMTGQPIMKRINEVLQEIKSDSRQGVIREGKRNELVGGNWQQTPAELEFGIRRAWRNARKCIMRSHCDELKLCDLRGVTSSTEMASKLVGNMREAFNGGNILPTVFVFPPRNINSRGPMIWNHQFLEFAGYEIEDGSILGDPASVSLTKSIIELGWQPPSPKGRWDLLPLVVMADNDAPAMIEIPPDLSILVNIRHPKYSNEFRDLDLKWVAFPALTRLGFDIGGVQYTAAPFIGWFMDAEIGVRDLADTFRYNVLPDVARGLGLVDNEDSAEGLDDLPEYQKLSILSRAQMELTHAVNWSYQHAKISMSDTLTASKKWCRYDDDFKAKNGFRLPADPYWLAPPQGSIVPVWHRGGVPCYQPKPMISRHVQDPLRAWEREKQDKLVFTKPINVAATILKKRPELQGRSVSDADVLSSGHVRHTQMAVERLDSNQEQQKRAFGRLPATTATIKTSHTARKSTKLEVSVFFCSAGTFAEKIAVKLHEHIKSLANVIPSISASAKAETLDNLSIPPSSHDAPERIFLIVASSTGQGEIPINGSQFIKMCNEIESFSQLTSTRFTYAIYGNGDSRYAATYNRAAITIDQKLQRIGGSMMADGYYQGDTAVQTTVTQALRPWWIKLQTSLEDLATDSPKLKRANSDDTYVESQVSRPLSAHAVAMQQFAARSEQLCKEFQRAGVVMTNPPIQVNHQGTHLVTLDIRKRSYEDLGCIQILPSNSPSKVRRALRALGVNGSTPVSMGILGTETVIYSAFLTDYIDLELPIPALDWLQMMQLDTATNIKVDKFKSRSSLDFLEYLHSLGILPAEPSINKALCLALPLLHPRTYSIASSPSYQALPSPLKPTSKHPSLPHNHLSILVKPLPHGRFSNTFLSTPPPSTLHYRLLPSSAASLLSIPPSTPLIIIATGAGFAPVRGLLQRRIASSSSSFRNQQQNDQNPISLFLGLKPLDIPLFSDILNEAAAAGILERLSITPTNEQKIRVFDRLGEEGIGEWLRERLVRRKGWVFVCGSLDVAAGTRRAVEEVLGEGGVEGMGERWVEEVF
ncbi:MAG: hypothetical protein Q9220_000113 [cf. Caloplaca sp. 1 TL-2023]